MRPPEIIETRRLRLRAPRLSDAPAIFGGYAQDSQVTRYLVWRTHKDIRETEGFLEQCVAAWGAGTEFPWVITLRENSELIGMLELRVEGFKASVGYVIARRFWGRGLMAEALEPIIGWALGQRGIYRVWAVCDVENAASARVMEKTGMQREGLLRRNVLHPNISDEPRDSYCYAVVK